MASLKLRAETKRWGWQLKLLRQRRKLVTGRARAPRLPSQHRTQGGCGCGHLGFRLGTGLKAGAGRTGGGVRAPRLPPRHRTQGGCGAHGRRALRLPPQHRIYGGGGGDEKRQRGALPLVWVGWVILWLFWRGGRVFWARERARERGLRDRLLACARCCIARGFGGMCRARG